MPKTTKTGLARHYSNMHGHILLTKIKWASRMCSALWMLLWHFLLYQPYRTSRKDECYPKHVLGTSATVVAKHSCWWWTEPLGYHYTINENLHQLEVHTFSKHTIDIACMSSMWISTHQCDIKNIRRRRQKVNDKDLV